MSTKAFDFYIFERKDLNKFMKWAKESIYSTILRRFLETPELKNILLNRQFYRDRKDVYNKITEVMQSDSFTDCEEFDLFCGVSFWFWKEKVIIKLYGMNDLKDKKIPRYINDFEYWNNTDKPDNINYKEWRIRERFFDKTIDRLERLDYQPLDFLSRDRNMHLLKLSSYYKKQTTKITEEASK